MKRGIVKMTPEFRDNKNMYKLFLQKFTVINEFKYFLLYYILCENEEFEDIGEVQKMPVYDVFFSTTIKEPIPKLDTIVKSGEYIDISTL